MSTVLTAYAGEVVPNFATEFPSVIPPPDFTTTFAIVPPLRIISSTSTSCPSLETPLIVIVTSSAGVDPPTSVPKIVTVSDAA